MGCLFSIWKKLRSNDWFFSALPCDLHCQIIQGRSVHVTHSIRGHSLNGFDHQHSQAGLDPWRTSQCRAVLADVVLQMLLDSNFLHAWVAAMLTGADGTWNPTISGGHNFLYLWYRECRIRWSNVLHLMRHPLWDSFLCFYCDLGDHLEAHQIQIHCHKQNEKIYKLWGVCVHTCTCMCYSYF